MPELPEVETIVRALRDGGREEPGVIGRTIERAEVLWDRSVADPAVPVFTAWAAGQTIRAVDRRAKFLVFMLERAASGPAGAAPDLLRSFLLVHLRMSGDLRVEPETGPDGSLPLQPHDRVIFHFTDGLRMAFNDARKFGRIWLVPDAAAVTGGLGPEPLDEGLTAEAFHALLTARRRQLKPLLLDQTFLAGLGNIYTDEALHLAGLHPAQISDGLDSDQAGRLLAAIRTVLNEGIRAHGASIDWVYRGGDFQNRFRVYRRTGEPCPVCGAFIERTVVAQRGTHFCPRCQKLLE